MGLGSGGPVSDVWGDGLEQGLNGPMSDVQGGQSQGGGLHSEVQCTMGTPMDRMTDRQT